MKLRLLPFDVRRSVFGVRRSVLLLLLCSSFAHAQDFSSGYGPPTSIPSETSTTRAGSRPARNWIDQTQAQADAKSIGCNQCHTGIEPMHKAPHVVLGCTDCHGGNPARGLTKEQA